MTSSPLKLSAVNESPITVKAHTRWKLHASVTLVRGGIAYISGMVSYPRFTLNQILPRSANITPHFVSADLDTQDKNESHFSRLWRSTLPRGLQSVT